MTLRQAYKILNFSHKDTVYDLSKAKSKAIKMIKKKKSKYTMKDIKTAFNLIVETDFPSPEKIKYGDIKAVKLSKLESSMGHLEINCVIRHVNDANLIITNGSFGYSYMTLELTRNGKEYAWYKYSFGKKSWQLIEKHLFMKFSFKESDENPWDILGLTGNEDKKEIKRAFLRLIKKWHPDRNKSPEALEMSKKIVWAYSKLGNKIPPNVNRSHRKAPADNPPKEIPANHVTYENVSFIGFNYGNTLLIGGHYENFNEKYRSIIHVVWTEPPSLILQWRSRTIPKKIVSYNWQTFGAAGFWVKA